ncbi:MAG: phage major capsid protein [Acidimicrobiia bacterium]
MNQTAKDFLREKLEEKIAEGLAITARCEREGRQVTASEKAAVERILAESQGYKTRIRQISDNEELRARIESDYDKTFPEGTQTMTQIENKSFLASSILAAGFDVKHQPTVSVNLASAMGVKAPTLPGIGDINRTAPDVAGLGQDSRFLYPLLPTTDLDGALSVQTFRQTGARTVTGTIQRDPTASTDKAILALTLTAVNTSVVQEAIIIDAIPTAVLESIESLREFLDSEGRWQIAKAIDAHVLAQIVASSPPFGMTGATMLEKLRNGVSSMRATGFEPNVVVMNPTDAAALDLTTDASGYVFPVRDSGTSSPLWGLRVVERIGAGTEPPYLLDVANLGRLYLSSMKVEADPYAGAGGLNFKRNLVDLRFELKCLYFVRQAEAARRVAAT